MLDLIDHARGDAGAGVIREIRLARAPVNALDAALLGEIIAAIDAAVDAQAIVVSGQPGVFSAGLDVPALLALDPDGVTLVFERLWLAQRAIATSPVPVVFALTGHCPAGGTVLAMHGDYRVMADAPGPQNFRIGLNEVQVGLFPGPLIHAAFRRLVGGHAAQLLTRGALVEPATALRMGLVDELIDPASCVSRALEVARDLCAAPRDVMLETRALVRQELHDAFGRATDAAARAREFAANAARNWHSPATQERLRALFSRRAAR